MNKSQLPKLVPMAPLALNVDSFARAMNIGRTSVKSGQIKSVLIAGRRLIPFSEANRLLCVVEQTEPQNKNQDNT